MRLPTCLREPHPYPLRCRLFGLAAKLALVTGHMSADNGQVMPGIAYRYLALAIDAARESGDESLAARAVNAAARQFVVSGHAPDAIALSRKARRTLRRIGPDDAAQLMACEAWAWAHLGRSEAVSRALDQAGELVENQHRARPPLFGHAELAGISGACFEVLACKCDVTKAGEYADRASAYITVALNGRERFYVRSRVLDLLGLANVRLTQGEPAEVVRTARMAMECAHG